MQDRTERKKSRQKICGVENSSVRLVLQLRFVCYVYRTSHERSQEEVRHKKNEGTQPRCRKFEPVTSLSVSGNAVCSETLLVAGCRRWARLNGEC